MKQFPGQLSFQDCWSFTEINNVYKIGSTFNYHGKRIMFCDLYQYFLNELPVLINSCTESFESYTLVKIVNILNDRIVFTTGNKHYGYLNRMYIDHCRGNVNFLCDSCNEQGWIYNIDGDTEIYPCGNRCLFNSSFVCNKTCDSIIRFDCKEWR